MKKKYELVKDDSITLYEGKVLYRIRALRNFSYIHKGDLGGYIEKEDNLSHDGNCWVFDNACVFDNAVVCDNATIHDSSHISEHAIISQNAKILDSVKIYGYAHIYENAVIIHSSCIYDNTQVYGNAFICCDNGHIHGDVRIYGNASIHDSVNIYERVYIYGTAIIEGNACICGDVSIYNHVCISSNAYIESEDDYSFISGIGANNTLTFFRCEDNSVKVSCNDFIGTIDEFRDLAKDTGDGYMCEEYLMVADLMEKRFKNREENERSFTWSLSELLQRF